MYPITPTSPLHEQPSSFPGALPHLIDALYADLDSVTRLLETRSPSARDLDDITHLIRLATTFREHLQGPPGQAGPVRQELTSVPSPPLHSSPREPIYIHTSPYETPCYLQDRCHFPPHPLVHPHHFYGDMAVLPPPPHSFAPDFRNARRCPKHPTFLNIVFRPLISLVGLTKGRNLTPSCHCLELSSGHSHPRL